MYGFEHNTTTGRIVTNVEKIKEVAEFVSSCAHGFVVELEQNERLCLVDVSHAQAARCGVTLVTESGATTVAPEGSLVTEVTDVGNVRRLTVLEWHSSWYVTFENANGLTVTLSSRRTHDHLEECTTMSQVRLITQLHLASVPDQCAVTEIAALPNDSDDMQWDWRLPITHSVSTYSKDWISENGPSAKNDISTTVNRHTHRYGNVVSLKRLSSSSSSVFSASSSSSSSSSIPPKINNVDVVESDDNNVDVEPSFEIVTVEEGELKKWRARKDRECVVQASRSISRSASVCLLPRSGRLLLIEELALPTPYTRMTVLDLGCARTASDTFGIPSDTYSIISSVVCHERILHFHDVTCVLPNDDVILHLYAPERVVLLVRPDSSECWPIDLPVADILAIPPTYVPLPACPLLLTKHTTEIQQCLQTLLPPLVTIILAYHFTPWSQTP
jgi:hypothetical protein